MNIDESWDKALKNTEIIRSRAHLLETFGQTEIPYIFMAESSLNVGDTVVRKGKVLVEKPAIIFPGNPPQFNGFEFENSFHLDSNLIANFLLIRGVSFPSLKYNNQTTLIDVHEGPLSKVIDYYSDRLQRAENVNTGLIIGPEECWQFSVLIFVGSMVSRSAERDINRLLDHYRNN